MGRTALVCVLAVASAVAAPSWHQVPFSYNIRCATLDSDSSGRLVRRFGRGPGTVEWDGLAADGRPVPAGCYVVRSGTRSTVVVRQH